jgi:LmbE family N-acetylglucosaminyl deacetylase
MKRRFTLFLVAMALAGLAVTAPLGAQSLPEALEAIQRARVTTRILYVIAHPDDESSSVLTYLARGLGADVALVCLTRGEGGQNALGLEQGPQLGILRTAELLAATKTYGVQLYFTRAPDFGYSKTAEETLQIWGDRALDDLVRVIRTFRPQIIINNFGGVRFGHGNHQAAGILTPQAFTAAADPKAFPQQAAEGLKPWRATLLLNVARGEAAASSYRVPADQISPIWGKSYAEIGLERFISHRTQAITAFLASPFLRRPIFLMTPGNVRFAPELLAKPLGSLAEKSSGFAAFLRPGLQQADKSLAAARQAALALDWAKTVRALGQAGMVIGELSGHLAHQPAGEAADALRWELDRVRERIDAALALAAALRLEPQADRSELVASENFSVRVEVRGRAEVLGEVDKPSLALPAGWSVAKEQSDPAGGIRFTVAVPKDARTPHSPGEWMLPWPPPLLEARVRAVVDGYAFQVEAPVVAERATSTRVDTLPLTLVDAVTLALEPRQFVVAEKRPPKQLELLARAHCYGALAGEVTVGVNAPEGWRSSPPQRLEFTGPGDQLVRFSVAPPANVVAGNYPLQAYAQHGADVFRTSVEPLPTLPTHLWSEPAVAAVRIFDVTVPEGLHVGYVAAENDPIPEALRQLGIRVELLDPIALAFSDLHRFDAISIGIRAYELRDDLARANERLLNYAAAGGALLVQYQRENVWDALKPAPYPASIGQPSVRITDENSPVRFLVPDHPVLNFPNKISQEDFKGWVQERGLYFWSRFDSRYQSVLALRDPGEEEAAGGLVYARISKGVYIYTGLAFFRQLPEGVSGAYRLFVNLLSQSRLNAKAR